MVKILQIFRLYFRGKIGHENVFHDIVEKKNALIGLNRPVKMPFTIFRKEKRPLKLQKKGERVLFLVKKFEIVPPFHFRKISHKNASHGIVERKNTFLD